MIRWSPESIVHLAAIEAHIQADNPRAASKLLSRLIERAEAIARHPAMGRRVPEVPRETFREVIEGNYRIVYRIMQDGIVEIVTVFEGHLPFERAPRRR